VVLIFSAPTSPKERFGFLAFTIRVNDPLSCHSGQARNPHSPPSDNPALAIPPDPPRGSFGGFPSALPFSIADFGLYARELAWPIRGFFFELLIAVKVKEIGAHVLLSLRSGRVGRCRPALPGLYPDILSPLRGRE